MVGWTTAMKYDFTTMSKKDIFEAKLKNDMLDFKYISSAKRATFLRFCESVGLLELVGTYKGHMAYKVLTAFTYETMGNYRVVTVTTKSGDHLIFNERSRPNAHVKQKFDDSAKEWLNTIMNSGDQYRFQTEDGEVG